MYWMLVCSIFIGILDSSTELVLIGWAALSLTMLVLLIASCDLSLYFFYSWLFLYHLYAVIYCRAEKCLNDLFHLDLDCNSCRLK